MRKSWSLLDGASMISYTRNFEDVMLVRALGHIERGFYVDVGASHPVTDSNTYALYTMGWRGVAVEPQIIFNDEWRQHRPHDKLVNAAIAEISGDAVMFKPQEYGQAATINRDLAKNYADRGLALVEQNVLVHTLTQVLDAAELNGELHLLSIDAEGSEAQVLAGLDWSRYRPWLVVLEAVLPGQPIPQHENWEPFLLAQGYDFVYFDGVNRFYAAKEHPELQAHFTLPPNVWDSATPHELHYLRSRVTELEQVHADVRSRLETAARWMLAAALRFKDAGDTVAFESLAVQTFNLLPTFEDVYWPLGDWLTTQNRRLDALAFYQQAVVHAPHNFHTHYNIAMLLRWEKRFEESEAAYLRALAVNPQFNECRMQYGMLLLGLGRYTEGWALFESRYAPLLDGQDRMSHNAPFPRWTGESLVGKSIILFREQGYGDEIMFARFVPTLKALGASHVAIMCQAAIKTLLQTVPEVDDVVCAEDMADSWPPYDYWCYQQSLPHVLGTTLENLPAPIPYLTAVPELAEAWRARINHALPSHTLKVGISWRGHPQHGNDHNRSLKNLAMLSPLWTVQGVSFVSVQTGDASAEALSPPSDQPLLALGAEMTDFASGAALIGELDLLISVDTAVVHIAGAMGVPCWVMIPRVDTDWRWLQERDDSPWYPLGMRIFRQTSDTEWGDVIDNLKYALQALSDKASSHANTGDACSF